MSQDQFPHDDIGDAPDDYGLESEADAVEWLRSRERAAFEQWQRTPGYDPMVHIRAAEWRAALEKWLAEVRHRAQVAAR
jgi:hypothetical protein